jgi:CRISPR-associated protein Cas2
MAETMRLAVAYDISDDANRRRVYRTLREYGAWQQYSVFELEVTKSQRVELEDRLEGHIDAEDGDRIRLYRLCDACVDATTDLGDDPANDQSNVV